MTTHHGVVHLNYYAENDRNAVTGHTFWLRIEESSGDFMLAGREGSFEMPWLRAMCSCGWAADQRFTIDSNARWTWTNHVDEAFGNKT